MFSLHRLSILLLVCGSLAAIIPHEAALERRATSTRVADSACTNGPLTRSCWSSGFSIATDFDAKSPPAGIIRTYNLEITNETSISPDGVSKSAMLINKQYPGPTITGNWGDTFIINVKNSLQDNGTSIHWHGIRQLNSNQHDGANGATECPIAPGQTKQYRFKATQFGTSWYHSHHSAQYGAGVVGTIVINGPATANYDFDLGVLPITDWYYRPAFELLEYSQHSTTGPATPDNILVNGTMKNAQGGGKYAKMTVTKGKKYRIRLVNTAVDTHFYVSLDGHKFTVITSDFVPIKPYTTDYISIAIGQRYDIVVEANQAADNYWFRVTPATDCSSNNMLSSGIVMGAIFSYTGAANPDAEPKTTGGATYTACADEQGLTPWVSNTVPSAPLASTIKRIGLDFKVDSTQNNLFRWLINGSSMDVNWEKPTLQYIIDGNTTYETDQNIILMPTANAWYYWWIQNDAAIPIPHPIHLHGHDFYVLKAGAGVWDGTTTGFTFTNPTRRDVATLPAGGHLILAFPADNPGAWLMHCHIAWHASEGLSMQFLERRSEILGAIGDLSGFKEGCASWKSYWNGPHAYADTDSGL